jgi:hypothetical protein
MVSTVIIILTFVVVVYGHECKDFKLSASEQDVIDMMKHYLHTSRKTECSDNKLSKTLKGDQHLKHRNVSFYGFNFQYFEKQNIIMQIICKHTCFCSTRIYLVPQGII